MLSHARSWLVTRVIDAAVHDGAGAGLAVVADVVEVGGFPMNLLRVHSLCD